MTMVCNMYITSKQYILTDSDAMYGGKTVSYSYPCTIPNSYFRRVFVAKMLNNRNKISIFPNANITAKENALRILYNYTRSFCPMFPHCTKLIFPIPSYPPQPVRERQGSPLGYRHLPHHRPRRQGHPQLRCEPRQGCRREDRGRCG